MHHQSKGALLGSILSVALFAAELPTLPRSGGTVNVETGIDRIPCGS